VIYLFKCPALYHPILSFLHISNQPHAPSPTSIPTPHNARHNSAHNPPPDLLLLLLTHCSNSHKLQYHSHSGQEWKVTVSVLAIHRSIECINNDGDCGRGDTAAWCVRCWDLRVVTSWFRRNAASSTCAAVSPALFSCLGSPET
jgi:hypothetical protein